MFTSFAIKIHHDLLNTKFLCVCEIQGINSNINVAVNFWHAGQRSKTFSMNLKVRLREISLSCKLCISWEVSTTLKEHATHLIVSLTPAIIQLTAAQSRYWFHIGTSSSEIKPDAMWLAGTLRSWKHMRLIQKERERRGREFQPKGLFRESKSNSVYRFLDGYEFLFDIKDQQ